MISRNIRITVSLFFMYWKSVLSYIFAAYKHLCLFSVLCLFSWKRAQLCGDNVNKSIIHILPRKKKKSTKFLCFFPPSLAFALHKAHKKVFLWVNARRFGLNDALQPKTTRESQSRRGKSSDAISSTIYAVNTSTRARKEGNSVKVDVDRYLLDFKSHRQSIKHNYAIILASRVHPALEEERLGDKASWKSKR